MSTHLILAHFELHIPHAQSLKQKRSVISSLKTQLSQKFNLSIAEVGNLDKWQRATLALAVVGNDPVFLDQSLAKISGEMTRILTGKAYILSTQIEVM